MSCPDCFRGGKATGTPKGTMSTLHDVETYVAEPPNPSPTHSTIIIFTDAFGLSLVNNKLLADAFAARTGFRVLVPDIIPGGPMSTEVLPLMDAAMAPAAVWNIPAWLSKAWSMKKALGYVIPWYNRGAGPSPKTVQICLEYARKVKASLPESAKLGVAGYCWGGYQGIHLCAEASVDGGDAPLVDALFFAHPAKCDLPSVFVDAVTKFKTPVSLAHAKDDISMKTAMVEQARNALKEKVGDGNGNDGHHYEIRIYEGCVHGFAVRARPGNEKEGEAADEALKQATDWFMKWL